MKILLIGNFAPPFEEENLQNITLYNRLTEDGHECSAINISKNPAADRRFIDPGSDIGYLLALIRCSRKKDVIHFSTKGYLRVGLLKMMLSIFIAKLFRAKSVVTFYSEFFSILGQMRSPFGGTQTLFTSFFLADRIIFCDSDTYNVATMYKKKENYQQVPSFIHVPDSFPGNDSLLTAKLKHKKTVIGFSNITPSSFLLDILKEFLAGPALSNDTAIVISSSAEHAANLKAIAETASGELKGDIIFIEQDDIQSALTVFSEADIILRPLTCDGEMFFDRFTVSVRKVHHKGQNTFFPNGLVFIKEGTSASMCADIIRTMASTEARSSDRIDSHDPYETIKIIYGH
ncbi:MAG: hypothetical protein AB1499_05595 [Nitrospirota bacterium]